MRTKERLANALQAAGAPADMVALAQAGYYDDIETPIETPITQLVIDCRQHGLNEIAEAAMSGEYDATGEEWKASRMRRA